jgi:hypothetical protein
MVRGIVLFFSLIYSFLLFGQGTQPKPQPPIFQRLTLDPSTGIPTLYWQAPPFSPIQNPTGFIIYKRLPNEIGNPQNTPIATVNLNSDSNPLYSYTDTEFSSPPHLSGLNGRVEYLLASDGINNEPSQLTSTHGSIYLDKTSTYDKCANKLNVRWLHYLGWGNRIEKYDVYMGNTPVWESMTIAKTVSGNVNQVLIAVEANSVYYLYVEAKKSDSDFTSKSNLIRISTEMPAWPTFLNVDSIISGNQQNYLHFTIDTTTELRKFEVIRWEKADSMASIFTAKNLHSFTNPKTSSFSDTTDSWSARTRPFYYRINAYDICNRLVRVSNLSNSTTIRVVTRGIKNEIRWDSLYSKNANPRKYFLYRTFYPSSGAETELIFETDQNIDLNYVDDLSPFKGLGYSGNFCYYAEAKEFNSNDSLLLVSRSRTVCVEMTPDIVMPNAIDPTSNFSQGQGARNLFVPTISFEATYSMLIYNRWGEIVFQSNNSGWNGYLLNGKIAPEGTYVYKVEVELESKRKIVKTGNVTVLYGKNH